LQAVLRVQKAASEGIGGFVSRGLKSAEGSTARQIFQLQAASGVQKAALQGRLLTCRQPQDCTRQPQDGFVTHQIFRIAKGTVIA